MLKSSGQTHFLQYLKRQKNPCVDKKHKKRSVVFFIFFLHTYTRDKCINYISNI